MTLVRSASCSKPGATALPPSTPTGKKPANWVPAKKKDRIVDFPKLPLGATPSSAVLQRFLHGILRGDGVLPQLACEIVQNIAAYLTMPALGNLRLTCKEIESKTLWYFAKTYFREVKFMHSKYALEALVAMSRSRMAQYVQTLALGPPSNDQGPIHFHENARKLRLPATKEKITKEITSRMWDYAEENRTMRALSEDARLIKDALQNLQSVTKIQLLHTPPCMCGCCGSDLYGEHHLVDVVGAGTAVFVPIQLDVSQSYARLLYITLRAAETVDRKLDCIDAQLTNTPETHMAETQISGFGVAPLDFPLAVPTQNSSQSAFASLSTFKLYIAHNQDMCLPERRERFVQRLVTFLNRAPNLRTLGLTFGVAHGATSLLEQLMPSDALLNIEALELSALSIECCEFLAILEPLRSRLRALKLYNFTVYDRAWEPILDLLKQYKALREVDFKFLGKPRLRAEYKGDAMVEFLENTFEEWCEMEEFGEHTDGSDYDTQASDY